MSLRRWLLNYRALWRHDSGHFALQGCEVQTAWSQHYGCCFRTYIVQQFWIHGFGNSLFQPYTSNYVVGVFGDKPIGEQVGADTMGNVFENASFEHDIFETVAALCES